MDDDGGAESVAARDASTTRDGVVLAEHFADVARILAARPDEEATLVAVCRLAVDTIAGAQTAGVSVSRGRTITSWPGAAEVPGVVDRIQAETREGPGIDAIVVHDVYVTGDLREETRWPAFASRAHQETGVTSVLSVRLFVESDTLGALNLYSERTDAFDDVDLAVAAVFATHAAVAVDAVRRQQDLLQALAGRDVIGQAKGILMRGRGLTEGQAVEVLIEVSQRLNRKLREVAGDVARTGEVPDGTDPIETPRAATGRR